MGLAEDIEATWNYLNAWGWFQGDLSDKKSSSGGGFGHCAIGAAREATAIGMPDDLDRYRDVVRALDAEVKFLGYPYGGVVALNDAPDTTFLIMASVFGNAVARARRALPLHTNKRLTTQSF